MSRPERNELASLCALIFLQMLPATLLTAAIRPLFAVVHRAPEWSMQAFMAMNMAGAIVTLPFLGRLADRITAPRKLAAFLAGVDGVLLLSFTTTMPLSLLLALRTVEGAVHVGAATILIAEAARHCRAAGAGRRMGLAGAAVVMAIAAGTTLGSFLVAAGPRTPFIVAACVSLIVGLVSWRSRPAPRVESGLRDIPKSSGLAIPISAAFVERFTVGCLIVTFALFAHRVHGLSDRHIGILFSLLTVSFAFGMYPLGRLADRVPRSLIMAGSAVLYAASLLTLVMALPAMLPLSMVMSGIAAAGIFSATLGYATALTPEQYRGHAMAMINLAGCAGMLAGPTCAGLLIAMSRSTGMENAYGRVFLLAGSSVILWLALSVPWLVRQWRGETLAAVTQHQGGT